MKGSATIILGAAACVMAAPRPHADLSARYQPTSLCQANEYGLSDVSSHHVGDVLKKITGTVQCDYGQSTMLGCKHDTAIWLSVATASNGQNPTSPLTLNAEDVVNYVNSTYTDCYQTPCCDIKRTFGSFKYVATTPSPFNITVTGDKHCSKKQNINAGPS